MHQESSRIIPLILFGCPTWSSLHYSGRRDLQTGHPDRMVQVHYTGLLGSWRLQRGETAPEVCAAPAEEPEFSWLIHPQVLIIQDSNPRPSRCVQVPKRHFVRHRAQESASKSISTQVHYSLLHVMHHLCDERCCPTPLGSFTPPETKRLPDSHPLPRMIQDVGIEQRESSRHPTSKVRPNTPNDSSKRAGHGRMLADVGSPWISSKKQTKT